MVVQSFDIVEYFDDRPWVSRERDEFTWDEIEEAIREMDPFYKPTVTLRLDEDIYDAHHMSVIGGNGVYAINGAKEVDQFFDYFDDSMSDKEIDIWTSDQGYSNSEKYVCYDVERVLAIVKHYSQNGTLDPSVKWEFRP